MEPAVTKFWHIAYVVPGTEKFFATELNRKAILCFFPVKLVLTPIGKKKAATLFPGYVFVHGASASKFFAENEAERFKGYLYTIMTADESVPYYRLDNQTVLDLMDSMMKGEFDFTKPAAIGTLRVGDTVEHTIPQSEATFLKGTGVILSKNRKTAQLLWSNRVVKIPLLFLRKAVHKVSLTE